MEQTLIILKPDCMKKRLYGMVLDRFAKAGLFIAACKMMQLQKDILREHYAHVADKPFYPNIETFMLSEPVMVLIVEGKGAIKRVRDLLGPTNSKEAPSGTIRGDMGTDIMMNIAHASDSVAAAEEEIERFFGEFRSGAGI